MDRNKRSKSDYFCPVPGKPVSARINPKFPLASPQTFPYSISSSRGRSSAGRALDWQSRGQGFDPPRLHHRECKGLRYSEGLFHAKTPRAANLTYANKKLHNLFPMSVHSLLAKRDYQCRSPFHLGFRNAPNYCQHPNNLRQHEQHPKTTPLSTSNERYVVQRSLNQFHKQLVLGYLTLHEFNCAHGSSKPQSAGSISIRP